MRYLGFFFSIFFVLIWWCFFLFPLYRSTPQPLLLSTLEEPPISRELFIEALSGNEASMHRLLSEWEKRKWINCCNKKEKLFSQTTKTPSQKILPQTYAAAEITTALLPSEEIVSIPKGCQLLPPHSTIKYSCQPLSSEQLFLLHPDLVIISSYSDPKIAHTLKKLKIASLSLKAATSFSEIKETILLIGKEIHEEKKTEFLIYFMESAIEAMKSSLQEERLKKISPQLRTLFLRKFHHWNSPIKNSLTDEILTTFEVKNVAEELPYYYLSNSWQIDLDRESILLLNPDCIIFSGDPTSFVQDSTFSSFSNKKLFSVDSYLQDTVSQYHLLAYYDIYRAIYSAEQL